MTTLEQSALLAQHIGPFQTALRGLTKNHPTEKAFRIIDFKIPTFVAEMRTLGIEVDVQYRIGREGVILTGILKE